MLSAACAAIAMLATVPSDTAAWNSSHLTPEQHLTHEPNELGRVPVFMYHNIVPNDAPRDSSVDPYMYRTYDEFWNDMLWLYEHDFYLVGMNDLISGNLDVPLGKHPVVFTFDDGSSLHFSYIENEQGEREIDPNCAVGIMERFHAQYPDFGRGAHFGLVPAHKFSWPQHEQDEYFDEKVQWLMANGYEVGNHTLSHPFLTEIDDEEFVWTVTGTVIWADELMGVDHPANATRVLTLPFGMGPNPTDHPSKYTLMTQGMTWEGHHIQLTGVLELKGGSSEVPWSKEWNAFSILRLPVQDDVMDLFKDVHLAGEDPYYTSDGNLDTVTVPWPLPEAQWGKLNVEAIHHAGKTIAKYHPESGRPMHHHGSGSNISDAVTLQHRGHSRILRNTPVNRRVSGTQSC
jgi:peptidoglycan/xylan/chitin deacetylase (PgdA/CDA1 family)